VTLTLPVLNAAASVVFVCTGSGKKDVVAEILAGEGAQSRYPAALVRPVDGELVWLLDEAAAEKVKPDL